MTTMQAARKQMHGPPPLHLPVNCARNNQTLAAPRRLAERTQHFFPLLRMHFDTHHTTSNTQPNRCSVEAGEDAVDQEDCLDKKLAWTRAAAALSTPGTTIICIFLAPPRFFPCFSAFPTHMPPSLYKHTQTQNHHGRRGGKRRRWWRRRRGGGRRTSAAGGGCLGASRPRSLH